MTGHGTPGLFSDHFFSQGIADLTLDDVIITGPAGTISTAYTVSVHGSLSAFASVLYPDYSGANASVVVQLFADGFPRGYETAEQNDGLPLRGTPQLVGGGGDVTSDRFTVTANQFFTVELQLGSGANTTIDRADHGKAGAVSNYADTLTFATDGPVFDLPPGYTAYSVSGHIVDNRFVAVPSPQALAC